MANSLNATQRRLKRELDEIAEIVGVDYWNIRDYEPESWTPRLHVMKRQLVRGEVVTQYTLIDDLLSTELCKYSFRERASSSSGKPSGSAASTTM